MKHVFFEYLIGDTIYWLSRTDIPAERNCSRLSCAGMCCPRCQGTRKVIVDVPEGEFIVEQGVVDGILCDERGIEYYVGGGVHAGRKIEAPYDSLQAATTAANIQNSMIRLAGR